MPYTPPYVPSAGGVELKTPAASAEQRSIFLPSGRVVGAKRGREWLEQGWKFLSQQPGAWLLLMLALGAGLCLSAVVGRLFSNVYISSILGALLFVPGMSGSVMLGCQALQEGKGFSAGPILRAFKKHGTALLLLGLVGIVLVVIAIIPFAYLMLLVGKQLMSHGDFLDIIFMGIYWLAATWLVIQIPIAMIYWVLCFATALVALNGVPPLQALQLSCSAIRKNAVPFLRYGAMLFGLAVVSMMMPLAFVILLPAVFASAYAAYCDIFFT